MALFKILSNMIDNNPPDPFGYIEGEEDDALVEVRSRAIGLPNTFNQGYCYFDRSTGKFWIDTTPTDNGAVTLLDKNEKTNNYVQGRIPINAYYADLAKLATSATYDDAGNTIASTYLKLSGGNMTGHIYLTGSQANSSTANTSQLIFGTPTTEHIAISSNTKALILNPTHNSTTNQIVLYLDKASKFPSGIEANITGNLTGKATTAGTADIANSVAWNNVSSKPTTLSGYGITDAKINNGTIILGSNSITPLTSHQTVSNKGATLVWGSATTIATIGSTNIKVSLPANPDTDTKVTQNNVTTANDYRVLLSASANDTAETNTVNKNTNLRYNPSTNTLSTGNISSAGNLTITGNTNLNGETYAESVTAGSLLVNGNTNFVQIPTAPTPATTSNDTSIATTAFVKNNLGGLSGAMHFKGTTTTALDDGTTTANVTIGSNSYTPSAGDVVLYGDSEFVWTGSIWERFGRDSSFKVQQNAVTTATTATGTTTTFVSSVTQDANGVITVTKQAMPTYNNYSLPLAADGTLGGIQIGYVQSGQNYPVQLSSEKAYVNVPWTDTKNTAGSTDTSSKIFLIGATSQAANPQTYSDSEVYVQNGSLYLVRSQDASGTANNKPALIVGGADTTTHMEIDANEIQAKSNGITASTLYLNNDGGLVTVGSGGLTINSLTASQAISTDANKKLVSTDLTVSDPIANGTGITYIDTISQNATGKITATKSTVRSASTTQTGVTQYTADNLNTWINQLSTGSSTPTDADYYISQYVGGGTTTTTYHRRPMSALWTYIKDKITTGTYWANIKISDAAAYNAAPEMATLKLNGNTSATAASTSNVSLVYNSTTQALDFVFA